MKTLDELIEALEKIRAEKGGQLEVGYIDNGDFAENGGWTEPEPRVSKDVDGTEFISL
ncbi:hypothetical protein D3C81_442020 [compost metagenome]